MKKVIVLLAVLALTACSSVKLPKDEITSEAAKFTQDFGKVEVTFSEDGNWTLLKSSATAAVPIEIDAGLEQGMNIATLRAKRNIIEFINTDLKSSTTTEAITKSLAKNMSSDEENSKQRAANIAQEVTEKISVEANGILRGVYIVERKLSSDKKYVVVTVQVDKRSMRAASQVRASL